MKQRKERLVSSYFRDVREDVPEEVFEQQPEGGEGAAEWRCGGDQTRQRGRQVQRP